MHYLALTLPNGKTIGSGGSQIPTGGMDVVKKVASSSIAIFLIVGVVTCLVFIVLGGIQWTSSEGDKSKVTAARSKIIYAILGLIIMFLAFFIMSIIGGTFGVKFF